jgi:dipeptidyl aminopeptidase/acylaminoacyl peptidase
MPSSTVSSRFPANVSRRWWPVGALLLATLVPAAGDTAGSLHKAAANWKLADRFTTESLRPFLYSTTVVPGWINKTDSFWYEWRDSSGIHFWKVDAKGHKKAPLFDTAHMASLLTELTHKPYDADTLPFSTVTFDEKNANLMRFVVAGTQYEYDFSKDTLKSTGRAPAGAGGPGGFGGGQGRRGGGGGRGGQGRFGAGANRDFRDYSPDHHEFVYAMDHNLYIVYVTGGSEAKDGKPAVPGKEGPPIQLTKDGEKYYSFGSREDQIEEQRQQQEMRQFQTTVRQQDQQNGVDGGGQGRRGGAGGAGGAGANASEKRVRTNAVWSKDSKHFFITRTDTRKVKDLYLVNSLSQPRPTLYTYKYEMPGEADVPQHELYGYDVAKRDFKKLKVDKYKDQELFNIHWQDTTSDSLRFIRRDRLQRHLELCEMTLATQAVKVILSETSVDAPIENQDVRYVKSGGDFLWFSERDGWGHYYLYTNDGTLKHEVAPGAFRASEIVDLDADKGILWFRGQGREAGEDPYYKHLYRCHLDGKDIELLDAGDSDHNSTLSPDKEFVVDVSSRTDMVPTAVLRDSKGRELMGLEQTDISKLLEMGWKMPQRFQVKAADGITDIYGNMWKPTDFNPAKKYPIIANVYPGPQTESVSTGFAAATTNQRLAELGFIVIQIGNRGGSPDRSSAYHRFGYYNLRDYGLADKKVGIEQLASRFPWIDIDRVGIYGHSGGSFMTAAAMMLPPYNDFFKVGVASSGNHDNNIYNLNWSEENHGLKEIPVLDENGNDTGETTYSIKVPTNIDLAPNLKGKLLLVTGDMDNNVSPANTIRLVNALIRANKRFDFMLMPGQAHGYGPLTPYFTEMILEYFAEHLLGDYQRDSAEMHLGG